MYKENPKFKPEEILVYLRKSRSDDPALTIEEVLERHEADLREWQERNLDSPIPPENWYREVVSGESLTSRLEFRKLLKRMEDPKIKGCLVYDCTRIGRPDLEEIGKITKLFLYTSTMVITPHRIFDLSDDWVREKFQSELMKGADYLEFTKKVLGDGKKRSQRSGFYLGIPPYGYEKIWVADGKRERPTLSIVEPKAKVVRMIFNWYANEEIGATKICQRLNELGIPAMNGGLWKKSSVTNIIKNEHYIGKIIIKKHVKINTVEDLEITKHIVFNPDYELVDGKHPAIIDEDLFYKANNKISRHKSVKPNTTLQNPLASILRCECGKCLLRKKNHNTYRYLCDEQIFCGNASCGEAELIEAIIKGLKENLANLSAKVTNEKDNKKEKHTEYVSLIESRLIEIEKKELSLWDKYTEENMPKHIFDKLIKKCAEEKHNLEQELENAHNNAPTHIDYKDAVQSLHQAIDALGDNSVSASAKNKLLLKVIDKIVYRRPKAIRMTVEEAKAKGVTLAGGWYCPEFELDIHLKV